MTEQPGRMEQLGTLLTAMALVILTGQNPAQPKAPVDQPINIANRPKRVVPLRIRYAHLFGERPYSRGIRYKDGCNPRAFINARFGVNWAVQVEYLLNLECMPSAILRALALGMSGGDHVKGQQVLDKRTTVGIRAAENVLRSQGYAGCLTTSLWNFHGNPDAIWLATRDYLEQHHKQKLQVAI